MRATVYAYFKRHHVGLLALFVAMGGVSFAAVNLPNNSVGPQEIKRNAVKAPEVAKDAVRNSEIRAGAVRTGEVADRSLLGEDFAPGELPAGPPGEPGPPGAPGSPGEPGADATNMFDSIRDTGSTVPAEVGYGSGVTAVDDPAGDNTTYTVTFAGSVRNCVAFAISGTGAPTGPAASIAAFGEGVTLSQAAPNQVLVDFFDFTAARRDTSFLIAAFC